MPDVELLLFDENQDQILSSTISDSEGFYSFSQLLPGSYYVAIAEIDTYIFATPFGGGDTSSDSDIISTLNGYGFTDLIELKSGEGSLDVDFGISPDFNPPPPLDDPMIEGYVWEDMNGDGLRDNEVGTNCLLYTSPSPRDQRGSRMPSSA